MALAILKSHSLIKSDTRCILDAHNFQVKNPHQHQQAVIIPRDNHRPRVLISQSPERGNNPLLHQCDFFSMLALTPFCFPSKTLCKVEHMTRSQCFSSTVFPHIWHKFSKLLVRIWLIFKNGALSITYSVKRMGKHPTPRTSASSQKFWSLCCTKMPAYQSPHIASCARSSALWMKVEHQLQHSPGIPNQSCIFFFMLLVSNMLKYIGYPSKEWNFLSFYEPFLWDAADMQPEERWQARIVSGLVASEKPPVPQRLTAVRSPFFMA